MNKKWASELRGDCLQTKSIWRAKWEQTICPHFPKDGYALDCGCGPAYYRDLLGDRYVGIDIQHNFPKGGDYVRGSASDMPFRDGIFDFVLVSALLEHVKDPRRVVSEVCRVLKENGCVALSTPSRFGVKYETLKAFKGYNIEDLERTVYNHGLRVQKRFIVGGPFSILFAEIESVIRPRIKAEPCEIPSFEGEQYYRIVSRSLVGRIALKIREIILSLIIQIETKLRLRIPYQGSCIFCSKVSQ